jgi:FkbM family methyltransferase
MKVLHRFVLKFLGLFGLVIQSSKAQEISGRLSTIGFHKINWLIRNLILTEALLESDIERIVSGTRSQLGQDVFALSRTGIKEPGFFVEFGATNGLTLSNTHLLESEFGWNGILCEPARGWHRDLIRNRKAKIDKRCVYSKSGLMVPFLETDNAELSTIKGFGELDEHSAIRTGASAYEVETVSLLDLLKFHNAPRYIDFLSVDTEGSEFEILNAFDFREYRFGAITVEHNYAPQRKEVIALLTSNGYRQVHSELSDFDDWFVLETNQTIPG